jgi:outer membrane protein assembly factor BamD (BamD/ComL family)
MSVSGISSTSFFQNPTATQSKFQQFRQEFQQLGKDLKSGNLTQAQSDFATLQQNAPTSQTPSTNSTLNSTTSPVAQAFNQLSQDLQSGNLTAAQSDFATLQQDVQQSSAAQGQPHHHHHHHASQSQSSSSDSASSSINQSFAALGQSLQIGNSRPPNSPTALCSRNSISIPA